MKIISNNGLIIIKDDLKSHTIKDSVLVDFVSYNGKELKVYVQAPKKEIIKLPILKDGILTISHFAIPTESWYNANKSIITNEISKLFYYNLSNNFIEVYWENGELKEKVIDSLELCSLLEAHNKNNIYSKSTLQFVAIWFLKKCYVNLCKLIFNNRGFSQCSNPKIDGELIYRRDLLWMALNTIKYYTHVDEIEEALRIIDIINGCNGLCNLITTNNKVQNCGCGK